jgi:hypothetical protein
MRDVPIRLRRVDLRQREWGALPWGPGVTVEGSAMPLAYLPILMFDAFLGMLEASMNPLDPWMPKVQPQKVMIWD